MAKPHRKDDRQPSSAGPRRQGAQRYGARPGGHRPEHFHKDAPPPGSTSWDHVASWYDKLVGDEGTDYHRMVLLPAALRMLDPKPHERFLDLCCGQGVFTRLLLERQASYVLAVDASPKLITAAKARGYAGAHARFVVGDARDLGKMADGSYDGAALLMAVHDLDPIGPVFASMAQALRPGGRAVIIMMHPCFRIPRQSSWGWDDEKGTQYRRLDRYAGAMTIPIATHPGGPGGPGGGTSGAGGAAGGTDGSGGAAGAGGSGGAGGQYTQFFHRPLAEYLSALGRASLAVVAAEELLTHRQSEPGGHSRGENRAKAEFPIFLALKAVRLG